MGIVEYVEGNVRMVDLYTDRAGSSWWRNGPRKRAAAAGADRLTQFGRRAARGGIVDPSVLAAGQGRVERSFGTDQDRLVKRLRLAKVKIMADANKFLEEEYWPEWKRALRRPLKGVVGPCIVPLTPQLDLASALSHVEQRVVSNDYTFSFAGDATTRAPGGEGRYAGKSIRIELHLSGALRARFEGQYTRGRRECGVKAIPAPKPAGKPVRKDHNRVAKAIGWMASSKALVPSCGKAMRVANERN